jgi:hypothetical protein
VNASILIATYGELDWSVLAHDRAIPSAEKQGAHEVLTIHDFEGTIASVRNDLAEQATGDWLLHLDADDELAPGFLDAMTRAVEREASAAAPLLLTPAVQQIKKGRPGPPFFFPECSFSTGNWLIIGTLVQRDLFMQVGGFGEHPHGLEDWNLWAKCVKAGARIVKVPKAVYIAHWNPRSKHHVLARNRPEYMKAYELARADV